MLIVKLEHGDNIDRALKKFKRKVDKTKLLKKIRKYEEFEKPSVKNRQTKKKAVYIEQKFGNVENAY